MFCLPIVVGRATLSSVTNFSGVFVLGSLLLVGCANNSGNTSSACDPLTTAPAVAPPHWGGTVFTIVMENHSRGQIFGNSQAPYINSLASQYAVAEGYHDPFVHPSEPNYFWMIAGQNFGVLDDADPSSHHLDATSHLADQIELAGLTWKAYQESMGAPCGLTSHGRYAAKHNPFAYFDDINGWDGKAFHPEQRCNAHVVDYAQLDIDIANNAVPRYVFITPNLDSDMHDGSIAFGDAWLARELPKLLATDAYKTGGVVFLMWDEGGGSPTGDDPPFIAISPNAVPGLRSQVDYDTSSYLKTVQNVLGLSELPCAAATDRPTVDSMTDLFTVAMAGAGS
jgi:phosphatidylinositol-3-phosphatase